MQIEVLGERYELLGPIGRGGMATIYKGRDTRMDRTVAVKVLREVYSTDPKFVTRFQREAKAASALQHPNIVQVYDYGQTDGNYFIVMELIEGTDLRRYLRSRGVLDVDRAIIIAHDVALGLGAAHRRSIVHRDVKPQNILVSKSGAIKLTDFGIASVYKDINAERLTTTGMTLGTVQYYAPEQAQGEIVNPAADVYALGIVMYEMLTGRTPFDGDTPVAVAMQHIQDAPLPPTQLNPGIPQPLEDIILCCLEKIPEMRFRDGSQLARALEALSEADASEMSTNQFLVNQGSAPVPITFNNIPSNIPSRPGASGRNNPRQSAPQTSNSSPNHALADAQTISSGYSIPEIANGTPPFNQQVSGSQQPYQSFVPQQQQQPADYGATLPYLPSTQERQNNGSAAGIITALIVLATILLLGFSVYLAAYLGFISLPFSNNSSNNAPSATPQPQMAIVPDLIGDSWSQAQSIATGDGFVLHSNDGSQDGVVVTQNPVANKSLALHSTIDVQMGAATVKVPSGLAGLQLSTVEQLLNNKGLTFSITSDGSDPNKEANTVEKVSPKGGTSVTVGSSVIIYVVNYNQGVPPTQPTPTPPAQPTPTPPAQPTPTPTLPPPTPTPTLPPPTPTPTLPPPTPTPTAPAT
jgi:serine/threonine protein kinase